MLTLVSAPAGFGKTTLIADWGMRNAESITPHSELARSEAAELPHLCWLSLDEQDNHLHRFWTYVVAALQTASSGAPEAQSSLRNEPQTVIEPLLVSLLNDIAACGRRMILVLDDLHVITRPEIFDSLDFFLDHLPHNLQLVIITREDPPLQLSRLRARGQLFEIRAADLRFSPAETTVFLNDLLNLNCSDEAIAALTERTEGWAAGLQLAALALRAHDTRADFVADFSAGLARDRLISDYLIDEVLSRQGSGVQHFLRRTSILDRFNAELCEAVLRVERPADLALDGPLPASEMLVDLERANLFLVPLDNERRWYRYHHLFAEFLQQRLYEAEADSIPRLRRAAACWLAEQGRPREALPYALAAQDHALAAQLIEMVAPIVLEREDAATVQNWIKQLPQTAFAQRPLLNIYYAWALALAGGGEEIEIYLRTATTLGSGLSAGEQQTVNGMVSAQRAYAAMFAGEHEVAETLAREALAALPPEWAVLRSRTAAVLGNSYNYGGRLAEAVQAYRAAVDWCEAGGDVSNATFNLCSLAEIYLDQGRLSHAAQTYEEALDFSHRHTGTADNPFTGFAHIGLARIARERNELDESLAQLQQGITLCREWRQAYSLAIGLLDAGILWTARGEWARAEQALREARVLARTSSPVWGVGMVDALDARLALAKPPPVGAPTSGWRDLETGTDDLSSAWAAGCGFAPGDDPVYELSLVNFTLARVLIAQKRLDEALYLLAAIEHLHKPVGRERLVMEAIVWQAVAYSARGERERASSRLQDALRLAEVEGYIRLFVDAGRPVADLLVGMTTAPFQQKVLAAFGATRPRAAVSPLLDPLNERELEILALMAAGMSNRAIGDELFLSVNTIRWYASQIYSKMGVSSRGTAVARARELGIL